MGCKLACAFSCCYFLVVMCRLWWLGVVYRVPKRGLEILFWVAVAAAAIAAITWLSAKILERSGFWCCFGDDYPLKLVAFHFFGDT